MKDTYSVMETDLKTVRNDNQIWQKRRERKMEIYRTLNDYGKFLEESLENLSYNSSQRYSIWMDLQKLKKHLKCYETPSIMGMAIYQSRFIKERRKSHSFVKRFLKRNVNEHQEDKKIF